MSIKQKNDYITSDNKTISDIPKGISVIIPTLNRNEILLTSLYDLLNQNFDPYEILIIDQSKSENLKVKNLLSAYNNIKYFHVKFQNLPKARNYGLYKSKFMYVVFVDDDIRCGNNFLQEHFNSLNSSKFHMIAGRVKENNVVIPKNQNFTFSYWTAMTTNGGGNLNCKEADHVRGGNFSLNKIICNIVGGFDETLGEKTALFEELDFCLRAKQKNYKILYNPRADLFHLAAPMGGCRIKNINDYIWSFNRNKIIIITRYLKWYHLPTAIGRLSILNFSFFRKNPNFSFLLNILRGLIEGLKKTKKAQIPKDFSF